MPPKTYSYFNKFAALSGVLMLMTVIPLFIIAQVSIKRFGESAYTVSSRHILEAAKTSLKETAYERAHSYDESFNRMKAISSLLAQKAVSIYDNINMFASNPIKSPSLQLNPDNGILFSDKADPIITAYWGGKNISHDVSQELRSLTHLSSFLMKGQALAKESLATHIITASGIGRYYTLNPLAKRQCFNLPPVTEFDLREGEPVTLFTRRNKECRRTLWTKIYKDDVIDGLMVTASSPVYDKNDVFRGITGVDIPIDTIITGLKKDGHDPETGDKRTFWFDFIIDENGNLIAFPKQYLDLFGLRMDMEPLDQSCDIFSLKLSDSSDADVAALHQKILNRKKETIETRIIGHDYVLTTAELNSVGWYLVVVARKTELLSHVRKIEQNMDKNVELIWKEYIICSLLALFISFSLIVLMIKSFISPIHKVISATRQIAKGDFSFSYAGTRKDEIGALFRSFTDMAIQLNESENLKQTYSQKLEDQIKRRTQELEDSNAELNQIKDHLEKTIEKRTAELKRLNVHLIFLEEEQRQHIASDLHDGVTQTLGLSISKIKNASESDTCISKQILVEIQTDIEHALRQVRSLIYRLSPPVLDDFGIDIAIGYLIENFNQNNDCRIRFLNEIDTDLKLEKAVKVTLYRCANELIANILKHSGTTEGRVRLSVEDNKVLLQVTDDGCGFDFNTTIDLESDGFGLHSLTERVSTLNGKMAVLSELRKGTTVNVYLPI